MLFSDSTDTHLLTGTALELTVKPRYGHRMLLGGLLLACVVAALAAFGPSVFAYFDAAGQVITLEKEKKALSEMVERRGLALEMEQATREELEKQVASLNEQLNQMKTELSFFKSQRAR